MTPEEHQEAAGAAFMADDLDECRRHFEAAFRGYRDQGDLRAAARGGDRPRAGCTTAGSAITPPPEVGSTGHDGRSIASGHVWSGAISSSR